MGILSAKITLLRVSDKMSAGNQLVEKQFVEI
jgi:hypothetical protein